MASESPEVKVARGRLMASHRWGLDDDQAYFRSNYFAVKAVDVLKGLVEDLDEYETEAVFNAVLLWIAQKRRETGRAA